MLFGIYASASGGSPVWQSNGGVAVDVPISSGIFTYTMSPSGVDWRSTSAGTTYWIQLTVDGKTLQPREKIESQIYALHSLEAENIKSNSNVNFIVGSSTVAYINAADGNLKNFVPTGAILPYGGITAPTGWLLCNGQSISRTTYADLFTIIGVSFGSADGSSFNVPDLRGMFLRGVDGTAGIDPDKASRTAMNTGGNTGNNVGSIQADDFKAHTHGSSPLVRADGTGNSISSGPGFLMNWPTTLPDSPSSGGSETRPINTYVNYIIKY